MENTALDFEDEITYLRELEAKTPKDEAPLVNHIIGSARTIQTAVLVVAYLQKRIPHGCKVHPDQIRYRFQDPTPENGWWSAEIMVVNHSFGFEADVLIGLCRAFVAGRGETWA